MNDAIETYKHGNYSISIFPDPSPQDPREWCNIGNMICFHKRYTLGDEHDMDCRDFQGWDNMEAYLRSKGAVKVLPLYLYDHSGLRMKIGSFDGLLPQGHAEFDSGQVGFIVANRDLVLKKYNRKHLTKKLLAKVEKTLREEVDVYDQYLSGQVYGYVIYDSDGESVDSCWGVYGIEEAKKQAEEVIS